MKQYTRDEAIGLGFAGLGAVENPMDLMASGSIAPLAIRYMVRNEQLEARFPGADVLNVFQTIERNAAALPWPFEVQQRMPLGDHHVAVDDYLDSLVKVQMH